MRRRRPSRGPPTSSGAQRYAALASLRRREGQPWSPIVAGGVCGVRRMAPNNEADRTPRTGFPAAVQHCRVGIQRSTSGGLFPSPCRRSGHTVKRPVRVGVREYADARLICASSLHLAGTPLRALSIIEQTKRLPLTTISDRVRPIGTQWLAKAGFLALDFERFSRSGRHQLNGFRSTGVSLSPVASRRAHPA